MHLNVPGGSDSQLCIFLRKCTWMLVGVLAPELIALWAIVEWYAAQKLIQNVRMKSQHAERCWVKLI